MVCMCGMILSYQYFTSVKSVGVDNLTILRLKRADLCRRVTIFLYVGNSLLTVELEATDQQKLVCEIRV